LLFKKHFLLLTALKTVVLLNNVYIIDEYNKILKKLTDPKLLNVSG